MPQKDSSIANMVGNLRETKRSMMNETKWSRTSDWCKLLAHI